MKKIVFLTGTRADFGKIKSLIAISSSKYEVHIFATGMHMNEKYGRTVDEIQKSGFDNIFCYFNHHDHDSMGTILANTLQGFSYYVNDLKPDLIVIHGDRVEALAGAIIGGLSNILTVHIEGGEVSGTIDESIRHAVTKFCHAHMVSNEAARKRLIQLGENEKSIFVIGSPDMDIMLSDKLPELQQVLLRYDIPFDKYGLLMFHPVTTEYEDIPRQAKNLVDAIITSGENYVVIYPNNDKGSEFILQEYAAFNGNDKIRVFPSLRFEYFLSLLKNAQFIIGNSSAGVREAPYYNIRVIDIGTRQQGRTFNTSILKCGNDYQDIVSAIARIKIITPVSCEREYGDGMSDVRFLEILESGVLWNINKQKNFNDLQ